MVGREWRKGKRGRGWGRDGLDRGRDEECGRMRRGGLEAGRRRKTKVEGKEFGRGKGRQ